MVDRVIDPGQLKARVFLGILPGELQTELVEAMLTLFHAEPSAGSAPPVLRLTVRGQGLIATWQREQYPRWRVDLVPSDGGAQRPA